MFNIVFSSSCVKSHSIHIFWFLNFFFKMLKIYFFDMARDERRDEFFFFFFFLRIKG